MTTTTELSTDTCPSWCDPTVILVCAGARAPAPVTTRRRRAEARSESPNVAGLRGCLGRVSELMR